jgi:hypothetical protein
MEAANAVSGQMEDLWDEYEKGHAWWPCSLQQDQLQ